MLPLYCVGCGIDRSVPASAADPGPCKCGSTARASAGGTFLIDEQLAAMPPWAFGPPASFTIRPAS